MDPPITETQKGSALHWRRASSGCEVAYLPSRIGSASIVEHSHEPYQYCRNQCSNMAPHSLYSGTLETVSPVPIARRRCSISNTGRLRRVSNLTSLDLDGRWQDNDKPLHPTRYPSCRETDRVATSLEKLPGNKDCFKLKQTFNDHQTQKLTRNEIEIAPGVLARLRGSEETIQAIQRDEFIPFECACCRTTICCIQDVQFIICPVCLVISPLPNRDSSDEGVGLGFTLESLSSYQ